MAKNRRKPPPPAQLRRDSPVQPHQARPESPLPLELQQAEARLGQLLRRIEDAEERLDGKFREVNGLVKATHDLSKRASEVLQALDGSIKRIAEGEVAEVLRESVAEGLQKTNQALQDYVDQKAKQIFDEYEKLYEIMLMVRDRNGRRSAPGSPDLREMVAGLSLAAQSQRSSPRSDPR